MSNAFDELRRHAQLMQTLRAVAKRRGRHRVEVGTVKVDEPVPAEPAE